MPEYSPEIRTPTPTQLEHVEPALEGLNRPERVLTGSDLQAQVAAAAIARIDAPGALGIPNHSRLGPPQDLQQAIAAPRSEAEVHISAPEVTIHSDQATTPATSMFAQPDGISMLSQGNDVTKPQLVREVSLTGGVDGEQSVRPDVRLEQRTESTPPSQTIEREALMERARQEVSQNVEQIRLDIVRGTQGRGATEALGAANSLNDGPSHQASLVVAVAPSEVGRVGTNLPEVRELILDRIARVQEQLYILGSIESAAAQTQSGLQGRGDFKGNAELRHDAKPESVVTRADRSESTSQARTQPATGLERPLEPVWLRMTPNNAVVRAVEKPVTVTVERANQSFDLVSRLIRTCSDIQLAKRIQSGVDTLCYTLFGVVAIGALAGDRATRFTYRTLRQLLREMRQRAADQDVDEEVRVLVEESAQGLAQSLVELSREVDRVAAVTVADVCGCVLRAETAEPIADIVVSGGLLGTAVTDEQGIFIFKNVPFHTPYELIPMHKEYEFVPGRIIGSCVELNFERFEARERTR